MPPRVFADDPDVAVDPPENYEDIPRRETARRREEGKRIINRLRQAHRPGLSQGRRKPPLNLLFKKKEERESSGSPKTSYAAEEAEYHWSGLRCSQCS